MTPNPFQRVNVLGVGISAINLDLAINAIGSALAEKRKGYICVTGVHGVMEAQNDEGFRSILNRSFLTTPDGMPMVWAGRLAGFRQMSRVYGPDLMLLLCEYTRQRGYSHFLYGGRQGVAAELQRRLEDKLPGLKIVGTYTPPFRPLEPAEEADLIQMIADAKPDIVWVGLSTPKQERFMAKYSERLDATLLIGVGAAFDFHSGRVRQAPPFIQHSGFEWLFRLCTEPRRLWRRYLKTNPLFLLNSIFQITGLKKYDLD
jgi:N-acetylglucosaminyldiphosphoundecaprenol N-acetyl-beta-D-mannosaminyltransferase